MPTINKLPQYLGNIFEQVKIAAQNADIETLNKWTDAAKQCEKFIQENRIFEDRVQKFIESLFFQPKKDPDIQIQEIENKEITGEKISTKERGRIARERWVKDRVLKNINIKGNGKYFHTENDLSVGIAFATENEQKPQLKNKWFLGMKDKPFDIIVLLCQNNKKILYDFILPIREMGIDWKLLSRSKGEVKIHIQKNRDNFKLLIPGSESVTINKYLKNYQFLI